MSHYLDLYQAVLRTLSYPQSLNFSSNIVLFRCFLCGTLTRIGKKIVFLQCDLNILQQTFEQNDRIHKKSIPDPS